MRIRAHSAIVYLFQETFVILYWIGLWSLIAPNDRTAATKVVCLAVGLVGVLAVKAFEPRMILRSVEAASEGFASSVPSTDKVQQIVQLALDVRRNESKQQRADRGDGP